MSETPPPPSLFFYPSYLSNLDRWFQADLLSAGHGAELWCYNSKTMFKGLITRLAVFALVCAVVTRSGCCWLFDRAADWLLESSMEPLPVLTGQGGVSTVR